ncbi:phage tail sheath C-terminal domain-containing protein [Streptomyces yangpuensis]|uniref:phage tail sheath C-terminal domain-containing protein n=1 Tax=Streptomyces yangpuensis TaxID=1648182 RepID=UPI0037140A06
MNEAGVNCLRAFPNNGLRVWGTRTLSTSPDWKYLNVRRLVSYVTDSIRTSTDWAILEPNGDSLQTSLRQAVTSFLSDQWRIGALSGRTPNEAFFVTCDENNNPPASTDGTVVMHIGVAPLRPAEFVTFTVTAACLASLRAPSRHRGRRAHGREAAMTWLGVAR